jgi:hypothetical protein
MHRRNRHVWQPSVEQCEARLFQTVMSGGQLCPIVKPAHGLDYARPPAQISRPMPIIGVGPLSTVHPKPPVVW